MDRITRQWVRAPADERAVVAGCAFDLAAADRVRLFFRRFLRHSEGERWAGKPFELLDWQWRDFIGPLFGWLRPDGSRRYRRAAQWVAKKNGKSTLCAGLVLYGLVADREPAAQVYGGAIDRDQASTIFQICANMVAQSKQLSERLRVIETRRRIAFPEQASFYAVLSKDSKKSGHGKNASLCVIDEMHVVDEQLYRTMRYAGAARRQPLLIEISTAGDDDTSFGFERYTYAKKVLAGAQLDAGALALAIAEGKAADDPEMLAVIYEAGGNDTWEQEPEWHRANPSLGHTITLDSFRADFEEAKNGTPADQAAFRQLRLNLWQSSVSPWLEVERWDACGQWPERPGTAVPGLAGLYPLPLEHLAGRECFAGLDLSSTTDLASLALVFPDDAGGYDVAVWYWVAEYSCRQRERQNRQKLDRWIAAGWIQEVEGRVLDYGAIRQHLRLLAGLFVIRELGADPWNAVQLLLQLRDEDGLTVLEYPQTFGAMSGPMKEAEKLILAQKIRHGGNPVLRWNFGNVAVVKDQNLNVRPSKKHSRDKIDGMVSVIIALGRAMLNPQGAAPSVFEVG